MSGLVGIIAKRDVHPTYIRHTLRALSKSSSPPDTDPIGSHVGSYNGKPFGISGVRGMYAADAPFPVYSDDQTVGLVYAGSIFADVSPGLGKRAGQNRVRRRTAGGRGLAADILSLYQRHGEEAFGTLRGHFGFCLWDDCASNIYLVRDRFGTTPLYVYEDADKIVFTTDFTSLWRLSDVDRAYDIQGLREYLSFGFVNAPRTLLKRVSRIDAGYFVRISEGRISTWNHGELSEVHTTPVLNASGATQALRRYLSTSVRRALTGPRAALLVDGGPASLRVAIALKKLGVEVDSVLVRQAGSGDHASLLAQLRDRCGFNVHEVDAVVSELEDIIAVMDEPIAELHAWPGLMLARHATDFPLVMSAAGGAELLGCLSPELLPNGVPHPAVLTWPSEMRRGTIGEASTARDGGDETLRHGGQKYFSGRDVRMATLYYEFRTRVPWALTAPLDRVAGHFGLEARFPYLDEDIFALAHSLPPGLQIEGTSKDQLGAFGNLQEFGQKLFARQRLDIEAICTAGRDQLHDCLEALRRDDITEVLNLGEVENIWEQFYRGAANLADRVWMHLVLLEWLHAQNEAGKTAELTASLAAVDTQPPVNETERAMILAAGLFDAEWYTATYADIADQQENSLDHFLTFGAREGRAPGPFFSTEDYLFRYPDVRASGMNPLVHFITIGAAQGRRASTVERAGERRLIRSSGLFDAQWYLTHYPDVAKANVDALDHYLEIGSAEGRAPGPHFDPQDYMDRNPAAADAVNPLLHYLTVGRAEGWTIRTMGFADRRKLLDATGWFDAAWYLATYPDVGEAGIDPIEHYLEFGAAEGRAPGPKFDFGSDDGKAKEPRVQLLLRQLAPGVGRHEEPEMSETRIEPVQDLMPVEERADDPDDEYAMIAASGFFDAEWYLTAYPDVARAGVDPLRHYMEHGAAEGRVPGPRFDSRDYLARHRDVAEARINPLIHYLTVGASEGRRAKRFDQGQ